MTSEFDRDTALVPTDRGFRAEIGHGWDIGKRPNGGFLLALATRALRPAAGFPDPVTVTGHFLKPPGHGPVDIEVEQVRKGGRHGTAAARLIQDGEERLRVLGTFADLGQADGPSHEGVTRPPMPAPDECPPMLSTPSWPTRPVFFDRFDIRLTNFSRDCEGVARCEGWIRFADGRDADVDALTLFADSFPPAVASVFTETWVPTIELTVHVRRRPEPGWLAAFFRTRFLDRGYLEEDGELWDSSGRLVALSRQLALLRVPPAAS